MIKSRFIKVFTYLGAIFLMSHIILCDYTFAVEINENVNFSAEYVNPYWRYGNSNWTNGSVTVSTSAGITIDNVTMRSGSNTNVSANVGDYYSFVGTVIATGMSSGQSNKSGFFGVSTSSTDCNILDLDVDTVEATPLSGNSEQRTVRYTVTGFCRVTQAISTGPTINFYVRPTTTSTALGTFVQFHNLTKWNRDTDLSSIYSRMNELKTSLNNIETTLDDILSDLNYIKDNMNEAQQKEIDETNAAVEDSETSGDQASTDATTATSSLLSVIGGFVSVITSASPSNCVIDAPLNTAFSNDRFHVDLCGLDLPAGIGALTSIIAIMLIVPFCISMFNKFIGIISEFQR